MYGTFGSIVILILAGFAIGTFFALPMIWFHIGSVSRKLDTTNWLLREILDKRYIR